jgi:tetratricopeptide (TPR) repeat protein
VGELKAEAAEPGAILEGFLAEAEKASEEGDLSTAIDCCRKALDLDPNHHPVKVLLAILYAKVGQLGCAVEVIDVAAQERPNCVVTLNWQVAILRESGDLNRAIEVSNRIIELNPSDPESHNNCGLCYLSAGRYEEASRSFSQAERLNPANLHYYRNGAIAHQHRKSEIEAEATFRRGLKFFPQDAFLNAGLGEILFQRQEYAESVDHFRTAVSAEPQTASYRIALAQALALKEDFDEAERIAVAVIALDPKQGRAHAVIGSILQHRGDFEAAAKELELAVSLEPDLYGAYFERVYGKKIVIDDRPLLEKMESMLANNEMSRQDRLCLNYGLGKAYDDLRVYDKAIGYFEESNRLALANPRFNSGFVKERMRRNVDHTIETFKRAYLGKEEFQGLDSELPIFIVGTMRSGSTLCEQILSSHPFVVPGGEMTFWPDHAKELFGAQGTVEWSKSSKAASDYLGELQSISEGADRVTDKMTENVLYVGLLSILFPKARFICCRRNPIDNCLSLFTTPFRYSQAYLHSKENIAFAYAQYARLMDHWKAVLPSDRWLEVRYESLIAEPERVARGIVEFCGLSWDDACLSHERNSRIVKTASKWQARQPMYSSSVGRWRNYAPWIKEFLDLEPEREVGAA